MQFKKYSSALHNNLYKKSYKLGHQNLILSRQFTGNILTCFTIHKLLTQHFFCLLITFISVLSYTVMMDCGVGTFYRECMEELYLFQSKLRQGTLLCVAPQMNKGAKLQEILSDISGLKHVWICLIHKMWMMIVDKSQIYG